MWRKKTKNGSERGFHLKLSWSIVQKLKIERFVRCEEIICFMNIPCTVFEININKYNTSAYNRCILRNEISVAKTKRLLSVCLGEKNVVLSLEIFPLIVTILSRSSEHIFYSFKMYHFTCSHPTTTTTTLTKGRCLCKSLTFLLLLRFTAFFDLGSIFQ